MNQMLRGTAVLISCWHRLSEMENESIQYILWYAQLSCGQCFKYNSKQLKYE